MDLPPVFLAQVDEKSKPKRGRPRKTKRPSDSVKPSNVLSSAGYHPAAGNGQFQDHPLDVGPTADKRKRGRPKKIIRDFGVDTSPSTPPGSPSAQLHDSYTTKGAHTKKASYTTKRQQKTKTNSGKPGTPQNDVVSTADNGSVDYDYEEDDLPLRTPLRPSGKTADWDEFLSKGENLKWVPPVHWFKHAPLANIWKDFSKTGLVVEAPNPFVICDREVNWYATIVQYAGYKALIEFQCLGKAPTHVAWMSYCSKVVKPIGYSDNKGILLHPPYSVRAQFPDYMAKARVCLKDTFTVNEDHGDFVAAEVKKCQKYELGDIVEVLDRENIGRARVARVVSIVGDRIHVSYLVGVEEDDSGFWFNCKSDSVHPVGWSQTVGNELYGVPRSFQLSPLSPDYFPKYPDGLELIRGQMLETRHPVMPHLIVAATVDRILKYGYFVACIQTHFMDVPVYFAYHVTSPYIFPCGFCATHKITLVHPFEYGRNRKEPFQWNTYMFKHNLKPAPLHLLPKRPAHNFLPGMKFESVYVMQPTYLGATTVRRVCGHLMFLSFDGFPSTTTMGKHEVWMEAESTDIYPLGYAELVSHEFKGRVEDPEEEFQ